MSKLSSLMRTIQDHSDDLGVLATEVIGPLLLELERLRAFREEWAAADGNTPGYNLQKAKTYGEKAAQYKKEREHHRDTLRLLSHTCGAPDCCCERDSNILQDREPWLFEEVSDE